MPKKPDTLTGCLLYTSDAADEEDSVDLGGRRIIKKKLGLSAAAIGISEEGEEDEKKAREGNCEIVFGSLESWLITKWQ